MPEIKVPHYFREYEILGEIGKGGMGKVYKAHHIYLDEARAIKVVHRSSIKAEERKESVNRFILEAKVLTKLRHPNLVLLYDFGTLEENTFFMVMEYINGESVLSRLRRLEKIPIDESIRIIREAAQGLYCAHQKSIVHRDISPDNLLIVKEDGSKEITKVIDFGIAKLLLEKTMTKAGLFMGKPQYSSPEQLTRGTEVDHRADIYSLGATLYHMVTGALPFDSKNIWDLIRMVLNDNPPLPSSFFPKGHFPKALDRIILKAMAKDARNRYHSLEQFILDLAEISSPEDGSESETSNTFLRDQHEIRTRLNTIIGYSEMLQDDALELGAQHIANDLRKVNSAGRHLLWYVGGDDQSADQQPSPIWNNFQKAKHWYGKMEWERAIEYWQEALEETNDRVSVQQWIAAAETRLQTEREIRKQLSAQLQKGSRLLDQKRLLDVKAVMDDAERNLSSSYRLKDLKQQWFDLLRRLKHEIDTALKEYSAMERMRDQLRSALQASEYRSADPPETVQVKVKTSQLKRTTSRIKPTTSRLKPTTKITEAYKHPTTRRTIKKKVVVQKGK